MESRLRHFGPGMRRNQNFLDENVTFRFLKCFFPFFFSFGFLFAAVIGVFPGLLGVRKCLKKSH